MKSDTINLNSFQQISILDQSWNRCWRTLCTINNGNSLKQKIIKLHNQHHRKYHTIQHLAECIKHLQNNYSYISNPEEIEIALWFHDAIYDIHATDNEEKSAELAFQELLKANVSNEKILRIHQLILATKHSFSPKHSNQMLIVDIDLSILGSPQSRFLEYEKQIREEFHSVPKAIFQKHRISLLMNFLDKDSIYNTLYFHNNFEKQARENINFSINNILS